MIIFICPAHRCVFGICHHFEKPRRKWECKTKISRKSRGWNRMNEQQRKKWVMSKTMVAHFIAAANVDIRKRNLCFFPFYLGSAINHWIVCSKTAHIGCCVLFIALSQFLLLAIRKGFIIVDSVAVVVVVVCVLFTTNLGFEPNRKWIFWPIPIVQSYFQ